MILIAALLLFAFTEPAPPKPVKTWMVLCGDNGGGYWIDTATGKVTRDPKLQRKKVTAAKFDPNSQLVPPPVRYTRLRNTSVTTAKGVTVRMLKNRLRLETKDKEVWLTKAGEAHHPVLRPDGKALAYFQWSDATWSGKSRKASVVVRDLATGKERAIVKNANLSEASWSPDGKSLAVGTHSTLCIYDAASGKRTHQWKVRDIHDDLYAHSAESIVWNPTGKHLAMRITFLGGRSAGADGKFEEVFGDTQLFLLDLDKKKFRILKLPALTCEGPVRGELRTVAKK